MGTICCSSTPSDESQATEITKPTPEGSDDPASHTHTSAATVSSINPISGSNAGGEVLTLTGTNFNLSPQLNKVTIGGTVCDVTSATATEIVCKTRSNTPANAAVQVSIYDTPSTGATICVLTALPRRAHALHIFSKSIALCQRQFL